jgi:hypothetical protein
VLKSPRAQVLGTVRTHVHICSHVCMVVIKMLYARVTRASDIMFELGTATSMMQSSGCATSMTYAWQDKPPR